MLLETSGMGSSWKFEKVSTKMDSLVSVTGFWFSFGSRISFFLCVSDFINLLIVEQKKKKKKLLIKINRTNSVFKPPIVVRNTRKKLFHIKHIAIYSIYTRFE